MKNKINIKRLATDMENKNIQVVSIDKENQLYTCNDGWEYPLMEGCENFTIEELQIFIDSAKDATISILKNIDKSE
jgi:hypothetical protein